MAREKTLYEGMRSPAVAATSASIAEEALAVDRGRLRGLPHVIDVDEAMKPDAPLPV
jgi:CO/xanthine dehydrogenase Mo-binding subunit